MTVPGWRRIAHVTIVLAIASLGAAYLRILPVTSVLMLGLAGAALARPGLVTLPRALGAMFLIIGVVTIEGPYHHGPRDDGDVIACGPDGAVMLRSPQDAARARRQDAVGTLTLATIFLFPAIGLVALRPMSSPTPPPPLPVARVIDTGRRRS